ncbi:MAG: hypothetical protein E7166_06925 [Firmicutes bacterium]|nr:hypothetical protein [Bacillota bacterium]
MKKKILIIIGIVIAILVVLFIGTGFTKNPNVEVINYSVSDDGSTINFTIGIPYSIGYTRGYKNQGGGVKSHYLDFYNTFGVINSSWGAKFDYVLELDEDDTEVYFNRSNGGYELVLQKTDSGEWVKVVDKYKDYELVKDLQKNEYASTKILVKFDGVLYGKSNAIIDYAGGAEKIGVINKLIDEKYVPELNNETNTEEILNAEVYNKTEDSIVLLYNNEYVLFGKIK